MSLLSVSGILKQGSGDFLMVDVDGCTMVMVERGGGQAGTVAGLAAKDPSRAATSSSLVAERGPGDEMPRMNADVAMPTCLT